MKKRMSDENYNRFVNEQLLSLTAITAFHTLHAAVEDLQGLDGDNPIVQAMERNGICFEDHQHDFDFEEINSYYRSK